MRRSFSTWLTVMPIGFLPACGAPKASFSKQKSIIDDDSLSPVGDGSQLPTQALRDSLAAIGRMTGGCTAFHLGQGLVATAGHCLPKPKQAPKDSACSTYNIQWPGQKQPSRCLHYVAYQFDEKADFALISVDPSPSAQIQISSKDARADSAVKAMVIGYPKDKALSTSKACETRWDESPEVPKFFHSCDTLPGHSGSPVLAEHDAHLIGVHDGDANQENYGSFLPPPEQLQDWLEKIERDSPAEPRYEFGPFGNNESRLLTHISSRWGKRVRLTVKTDLEAPYDKLIITDGIGRKTEITGPNEKNLDLPAPLVLELQTDYSGTSQEIILENVESYSP